LESPWFRVADGLVRLPSRWEAPVLLHDNKSRNRQGGQQFLMRELPLISVVIPCLNRAHFLVPTIESVLQQGYPHIECIVVDGGSTDGTLEVLKRYGGRIKWVSEPDNGHADAINKGWRMSKGEILAWLNADDVWAVPDAVSKAVEYLQAHPEVDVVYGDCGAIDAEGNLVSMSYLHEWDLGYAVEFCDHCIPQPAAFIRREILEKVGWLDVKFVSKKDHELWLRIGLAGNIRHIPIVLANARACPGYMAQQGDITAAACVALTKKFSAYLMSRMTSKGRKNGPSPMPIFEGWTGLGRMGAIGNLFLLMRFEPRLWTRPTQLTYLIT